MYWAKNLLQNCPIGQIRGNITFSVYIITENGFDTLKVIFYDFP